MSSISENNTPTLKNRKLIDPITTVSVSNSSSDNINEFVSSWDARYCI